MIGQKLFRLRCLPVAHGDSLLIEYGDARHPSRILVDGGPANRYEVLRNAIAGIPPEQRRFELLIVTHIDADHIDGAVLLLQDDKLGVTFEDVWFNGWPQLATLNGSARQDVFGPQQGEFVGALLRKRRLPWNRAFGEAAVVLPAEGAAPRVELAGGAVLTLLSPRAKELRRLRIWWSRVLREAGMKPGDWSAAEERLARRKVYQPPDTAPDTFAPKTFGSDAAIANGSSIAVLLEYGGRAVLLGADAYPSVLAATIGGEGAQAGSGKLRLDALKLPHHGSAANIDAELLGAVECPCYLVSTNGAYFKHPHAMTIHLVGEQAAEPEIRFNQLSDTTKRWQDHAAEREDGIRALYPPDGETLELEVA